VDRTRLTFDSFPRSGNIYTKALLCAAFPSCEVNWLNHRATFQGKPNAITVVRDPRDCVASWVEKNGDSVSASLQWYCRFTATVLAETERLFVSTFEEVTTRPNIVMQAYAYRFTLNTPVKVRPREIEKKVTDNHPEHMPRSPRATRLQLEQEILSNSFLPMSLDLYEQAKQRSCLLC
jgi:hypothetical protein